MNPRPFSAKGDKPLEVGWRVAADGRLVVIVLNFSDAPVAGARVEVGGVGGGAIRARATWESREIPLSGRVLTDDFEPYGVKVYGIVTPK